MYNVLQNVILSTTYRLDRL